MSNGTSDQMKHAIRLLAGLPADRLERLLLGLQEMSMPRSLSELASHCQEWAGISRDDAWCCAVELTFAARYVQKGLQDAGKVAQWWRNLASEMSDARSASEWGIFEEQLTRILSCELLGLVEKSRELQFEGLPALIGAKLITDLRPVYHSDLQRAAAAFVIVHSLKLDYRTGEATDSVCLGLNGSALEYLSNLIERARQKEQALVKQTEPLGISLFEVQPHG